MEAVAFIALVALFAFTALKLRNEATRLDAENIRLQGELDRLRASKPRKSPDEQESGDSIGNFLPLITST